MRRPTLCPALFLRVLPVLLLGCFATACSSGTGEDGDASDSDAIISDVGTGDVAPDADVIDPDVSEEVLEDVDAGTDVRDDIEEDAEVEEDVSTDVGDDTEVDEDITTDVQDDTEVEEDVTTDVQDDTEVEEDVTTDVQQDADADDDAITECDDGFELVDGVCIDIDECETAECGLGTCENTDGSFECVCDDGAELIEGICRDIDECVDFDCGLGTCENAEGSFECLCDDGAMLVDGICVDNDECEDEPCGENATCSNIVGGFECACDDGFLGDGVECSEDVCATYEPVDFERPNGEAGTVDCITESVCLARANTGPLYNSVSEDAADRACETSLSPAGTEWALGRCAGASEFAPLFTTVGCSGGAVVNQDLCLHVIAEDLYFDVRFTQFQGGGPGGGFAYSRRAASGFCPVGAVCEPGVLPAACECPAGYALDSELGECVDLDECDDGDACDPSATCVNTVGGFDCECPTGSEFEGDVCVDIDECEAMPCDENAACVNLAPDFICECSPGFEGDGFTCEIACDPTCGENEVCVLGLATPVCECAPGFELDGDVCVPVDFCERSDTERVRLDVGVIDCVTPSVCLQQAASDTVPFNTLDETYADISFECLVRGAVSDSSPRGTAWLIGTCEENAEMLDEEFVSFQDVSRCNLGNVLGNDYCMLSVLEGIRVDFSFEFGFIDGFIDGGIDLGGRPSDLVLEYVRSSLETCDDSNSCESAIDGAICGCADDSAPLADGSCDIAPYCELDCGDVGTCAFGDAGQLCICPEGTLWDGTDCADVPLCSGSVTYVHQPGAEGDCWSDDVCITRDSRRQIYNAVSELSAAGCGGSSPSGVSFAQGPCAEVEGDFTTLSDFYSCNIGGDIVGDPLCARIDATDELLDITFDSWEPGNGSGTGGFGFSYTRDASSLCASSATCNDELDLCVCDDNFEGDGLTCTFSGDCDLECGENGECVGGDLGPQCLCDEGFADLGEGCVDIDVCEGTDPVDFVFSEATDFSPDCISESVCLDRGSSGPLYNSESDDVGGSWTDTTPTGTRWAVGACSDPGLVFVSLINVRDNGFRPFSGILGQSLCLELLESGERHDLTFTDWSDSGNFSYTRRVADVPCGPNSTCTDNVGAPTCGCEPGFEANDAGVCVNIDDCAGDPCGTDECVDGLDTFYCRCGTVEFAKTNYGDEVDCITDDVCISRRNFGQIYNQANNDPDLTDTCSNPAPTGTRWGFGSCDEDRPRGTFISANFADCNPPSIVDEPACLEIASGGLLLDIEFSFWQSGSEPSGVFEGEEELNGGGGFAYTREAVSEGAACDTM